MKLKLTRKGGDQRDNDQIVPDRQHLLPIFMALTDIYIYILNKLITVESFVSVGTHQLGVKRVIPI